MADLNERIRQAFEARDAQARKEAEKKLLRSSGEDRTALDKKQMSAKNLIASREIFSNTRPDTILEKIRRDVWGGVGSVTVSEDESGGDVYTSLEYERKGTFSQDGVSEGGYLMRGREAKGAYWYRFSINAHSEYRKGLLISFTSGFAEQAEYGRQDQFESKIKGVQINGNNYSKAKEELEQVVMSICEPRIVSGAWPFKK